MAWRQQDVSESVLINEMNNASIQHSFEYLHQHRGGLLNIVATGKTGEGKSATLNTLLTHSSNPNGFFKEEESPDSVTKKHSDRTVDLFGMNCRLMDTIGLFDTEETHQRNAAELGFMQVNDVVDHHKVVLQSLAAVVSLCTDGIDAFLIVIKGTERLTFESKETMQVMLRYFGVSMLDHCIFVLTNADQAQPDTLKKMERSVTQYLRSIGYTMDVANRFIHFDNRNRPKQHVVNLLKAIEVNLQTQKGIPYTNIAFEHAQKALAADRVKLQNEMEAQYQKRIKVEMDKVHKGYQRDIQTLQRQLDEKAQLISKLSANAVEERKKSEGEINGLNNQLINLEKSREKDIDAAVQKAKSECDEIYRQQYRMMENCFQEQNRMMEENSKIVEALQQQVTALLNRPPVVEHHYHTQESGGGCMAGDSIVETPSGKKYMKDLKINDLVLSATCCGQFEYVPLLMWMQADPNDSMNFLEISTKNGDILKLTKNHKLFKFVGKDSNDSVDLDADELIIGDFICKIENNETLKVEVETISTSRMIGIFSPLTSSGRIVVDGILCSCYASISTGYVKYSHATAHMICAPIRFLLSTMKENYVTSILSKSYLFSLISINRFLTRASLVKNKFLNNV